MDVPARLRGKGVGNLQLENHKLTCLDCNTSITSHICRYSAVIYDPYFVLYLLQSKN